MLKSIFIVIVFILIQSYLQTSLADQTDLEIAPHPRGPACRRVGGVCVRRRKPCQEGFYAKYKGRPTCYKRRKCCAPIPSSTTTPAGSPITSTPPPTTTTTIPTTTTTTTVPPTTTTVPPTTTTVPTTTTTVPPTTTTTVPPTTTTTVPPTTTTTEPPTTTTVPPTTTAPTAILCPDGFTLIENQCFKFYNDSFISWGKAKVTCEAARTILAEPATTDTFIKLAEYAIKHHRGVEDWDRHPEYAHFWLGARGDGSGLVWDNRNQYLPDDAPWMHDQPEGISSEWCLDLRAESDPITNPLAAWICLRTHYYICEHVL